MNKTATKPPMSTGKKIFAAAVGNSLEWYDFSIFAFFASYIGHSFFVSGDSTSELIKTFLVFGVGFIARPLGAIVLGIYGDRVGRKAALTMTIWLMAIGVAIIAFAPPIWMIGAGAPILLLIGRIFQGFSAGGEIGGATAFLVESAPPKKKVLYGSILQASMGFSNILAAMVGFTISSLFSSTEIQEWAWRIPFILGLLIVPVGWYIRKNIDEPEEYLKAIEERKNKPKISLVHIFKNYPRELLAGFMFSILWTVCVYTLIIYMPSYYASPNTGFGFSRSDTFLAALIGNVFLVIGSLVVGILSDKIGMKSMILIASVIMLLASYPILHWLHSYPTITNLIISQVLFCLMVSLVAGVAPTALSTIFPIEIRSTCMSLTYNTAAIAFAGFTPALLTWATQYSIYAPSIHLAFASTIALIALTFMFKKSK